MYSLTLLIDLVLEFVPGWFRISHRAPGTVVGTRTPRLSNIEIGADTLAPWITRLHPGNLRVSDRARDPKLVESFVEGLKNLGVANSN